jgi:hypothetical protein
MKTRFIISNFQEGAEPYLEQNGFIIDDILKNFEKVSDKEILLNIGDSVMIVLESFEVFFKCYDLDDDAMIYSLMVQK